MLWNINKSINKFLSLLLVGAMSIGLLSGCGVKTEQVVQIEPALPHARAPLTGASGESQSRASEEQREETANTDFSAYLQTEGDTELNEQIKETADRLGTPLAVYNYLKNNIDYESYYGSDKGAAGTLDAMNGNDIDQASLFIAMLRHLGYPAEYVKGDIRLTESQAMLLTGADTIKDASDMLAFAGIPVTRLTKDGEIINIRMEHVWVRTYVPYTEYRGAGNSSGDSVWIELDVSLPTVGGALTYLPLSLQFELENETKSFIQTGEDDKRKIESDDKNSPVAEIKSPHTNEILAKPVDIVGSAYDVEELDFWKLEYRMAGEEEYILLNEGTQPIKEDVLGHWDTTMLMNGQYNVKLTVQDKGGNIRRVENDYMVEGNLKVGVMHIGFTDITAKLSGATVNLLRTYDSRNKTSGDFGYGWTLGLQGMDIYESGNISDGYQMVQSGSLLSTVYQMTETTNHDVTISYGDGSSDRFELTFSPERRALIPISEVKLGYKCVTNQKVKLDIIGDTTAYVNGTELAFYDENMYEPLSYKLTTAEGTEIYLNKKKGVYKIVDSNDNVITVDQDGYHSEDGKSITLKRDDRNRVISATDPAGKETTYAYDDAGDLISVTDSADRTVQFTYDNKHNLAAITDPMGIAVARNEYDDDGRLIATIDAGGNRMEYDYDVEGRQELVTDRLGNKTLYIYDDNGNILSTTDANGNTTKSTYDSFGNVLSKTDAKGNVTGYQYDANGNLTVVTDAKGNTLQNTYNSSNLVTSMKALGDTEILLSYDDNDRLAATTDAEGNETSYAYDRRGNVTGITDELGTVMTAKYDSNGNVTESTDSAGNKVTYTYDAGGSKASQTTYAVTEQGTVERTTRYIYNDAGELVQTIDADGGSTSVERNANGQMSAAVDSKGRRTEYDYDASGNISEIRYSDGTSEHFEYDAEGRNIKATGRTGLTVTYLYDKVGNVIKQTDARGNSTAYTYDDNYNLTSVTDATGAVTRYAYDELDRNISITDDGGNVTNFAYNELSLLTSTTDAKGNVTTYEYDKTGNRTKTVYPNGTYVETKYDERGRTVWQKNMAGRKTVYGYDGSDRLISVKQPNGAVTKYGYDQTGNLISITDANGNTTSYAYDVGGRRVKTTLADGSVSTSSYDEDGMLISFTDYNKVTTTYTYDGEDRLKSAVTGEETVSYTYDDYGRLTEISAPDSTVFYSYNKYGELEEKSYENGDTVSYAYDKYGRISKVTVSTKKGVINSTAYGYDKMNRLTRVVGRNGEATVYTYDANGNRETATFANGVKLTYTYDALNRLLSQKSVDKNGMPIAQYSYTLGANGERTHAEETGPDGSFTTDYGYDKAGRLIKETIESTGGTVKYAYSYDDAGNRTEKKEDGKKTAYAYNERNQLVSETTENTTTTYAYDANGNLLHTSGAVQTVYAYDLHNRLISCRQGDVTETYTYDAEGVRRSRKAGDTEVIFISDTTGALSQTLAETDRNGNVTAAYTRGDTLISQTRGETISTYLYDGHGDVRGLLNENGRFSDTYRYNAYGELTANRGETENHYLYTGEYYDGASGLYYLRARYMNPATGTFISMDTYEGSIYDPDTLHKYLYANGNPVKYSDPSGNMFDFSSASLGLPIQSILQTTLKMSLNGVLSGITGAAVTNFLGGTDEEVKDSFWVGFGIGFGLSGVLYVTAAISAVAYAKLLMITSTANVILNCVMVIASVVQKKDKETLVYGTLAILSLICWYQSYNLYGKIVVTGDKGTATVEIEGDGVEDVAVGESDREVAQIGDNFGKMGTYVENPNIKVDWNQYAKHAMQQMTKRGMTQEMVDDIVLNGKVLSQNGGDKFVYISKEGVVVVNKEGKLITVWSKLDFDDNMIKIVNKLFGDD